MTYVFRRIKRRIEFAKLPLPSKRTIYYRISSILNALKEPESYLQEDDNTIPDQITGADYPLAIVQIDHTKLDIIVVDEVYRKPISRPDITVAIDVYSRMIVGFFLSLDPPNTASVGICLINAILRKDELLQRIHSKYDYDTEIEYPCRGIMDIVQADNAGEFRGNMLRRACKQYGIDIEWRPLKKPRYGGHIERLLGTVLKKVHRLEGTTFSNKEERGKYDSEKHAELTLKELEEWITLFIIGDYHQRKHPALLTTPIKKYEDGILGTNEVPGRGHPKEIAPEDVDKFCIDLLPFETRTIQNYGVKINYIRYNAGVLRRFRDLKDPNTNRKIEFIFKYDPRNMSVIYFYDPQQKQYYRVPYRNTSHPPMSKWEYKKVRKHLEDIGRKDVDENLIFQTHENMRLAEQAAAEKTKSARTAEQRRKNNKEVIPPKTADDKSVSSPKVSDEYPEDDIEILPYDEIEVYD